LNGLKATAYRKAAKGQSREERKSKKPDAERDERNDAAEKHCRAITLPAPAVALTNGFFTFRFPLSPFHYIGAKQRREEKQEA
jgi:hypothetical protein